jgi:hypothetical protein
MNETIVPEPDTRTINEVITARIARLREQADQLETKLAALPADFLDLPVQTLTDMEIYV